MDKLTTYYIKDISGSWFAIQARTKREAKSAGVYEFGRGRVDEVRQATLTDIDEYKQWKGVSEIEVWNG